MTKVMVILGESGHSDNKLKIDKVRVLRETSIIVIDIGLCNYLHDLRVNYKFLLARNSDFFFLCKS